MSRSGTFAGNAGSAAFQVWILSAQWRLVSSHDFTAALQTLTQSNRRQLSKSAGFKLYVIPRQEGRAADPFLPAPDGLWFGPERCGTSEVRIVADDDVLRT
jgi:hypothetical protein